MLNFSRSEENYIKTIYHLQQAGATVATNELAAAMQTKPASITDMLKKLKKKKLVHYRAYYGCSLTTEGNHAALMIIRRHRLWEYFLSQKLGFSWNEVHEVAEDLEHISNEKLVDKLDAFLGYPAYDPHGDPIPDSKGSIRQENKWSLADYEKNKIAEVVQIGNQSAPVLNMLQQKNIAIGTRIEILKRFAFDQSIEVKTDDKHITQLSKELAHNIFIRSL